MEAGVGFKAGLEAGFGLERKYNRRSKTIALPGKLELPTLRITASRSNQLSYGSLYYRPKLLSCLAGEWVERELVANGPGKPLPNKVRVSKVKVSASYVASEAMVNNCTQPGLSWLPSSC